jgi:4-azaleucine resistance transporter AzlC
VSTLSTLETVAQPYPSTFAHGMRAAGPVVLGYLPIGFAFGVLARTAGLTVAEIGLMSLLVYAGSAQFIGTGMIGAAVAAPAIISTTFLVNLRHLLMSTALVPSFKENTPLQNSLLAYGITDETFAVNTAILQGRPASRGFIAGVHITSQLSWVIASVVGGLVGQMAGNTEALGLDFALPAMFRPAHAQPPGLRAQAAPCLRLRGGSCGGRNPAPVPRLWLGHYCRHAGGRDRGGAAEMMTIRPAMLAIFLGMALVTYLPRMLPLVVLSRFQLPPIVLRWLSFVPVSVLSALLAKELLISGGKLGLPPAHPQLLAAIPAFLVAALTRSLMGTVLTGIAAMALLRLLL